MATNRPPPTLGQLLLRKMEAEGLSQQKVANDLEVTRGAVWHWVHGHKFPSAPHQRALAKYLGTTIDALHQGAS